MDTDLHKFLSVFSCMSPIHFFSLVWDDADNGRGGKSHHFNPIIPFRRRQTIRRRCTGRPNIGQWLCIRLAAVDVVGGWFCWYLLVVHL